MDIGLHIASFTWPEGPQGTAAKLAEVAGAAEEVGFDAVSLMDHYFQMDFMAPASDSMLEGFDHSLLQCSTSRIVAEDGIYACPILVGESPARLAVDSLAESLRPCNLYHTACITCYVTGMTCKNY